MVCTLVDQMESGPPQVIDSFVGQQEGNRPSTLEAFSVHGLVEDSLVGQTLDLPGLQVLTDQAACFISRNPRFTAKKLHALIPNCLTKRWYEYPARLQGYPGAHFPANERMDVMIGQVESFGYGRLHPLGELLGIDADSYTLVFDENGPPEVSVHFGRRKIIDAFAEALLKCEVGTRFRLHGKEGYDFITGYCHDGPAFRERAFRLATTPSNLELVRDHHLDVYLERVEGSNYVLGMV